MNKQPQDINAIDIDKQSQFKGITMNVISVDNLHGSGPLDDANIFVKIRIKDAETDTTSRQYHHDRIVYNQNFYYNTYQLIDDDIIFEVYQVQNLQNSNKNNEPNDNRKDKTRAKLLATTKKFVISRQNNKNGQKQIQLTDPSNKKSNGKIKIFYEWFERQDIVGGIRCPDLSLKPSITKRRLVLENKVTSYKNLYSFWDGYTDQQCQFFPRKFQH